MIFTAVKVKAILILIKFELYIKLKEIITQNTKPVCSFTSMILKQDPLSVVRSKPIVAFRSNENSYREMVLSKLLNCLLISN